MTIKPISFYDRFKEIPADAVVPCGLYACSNELERQKVLKNLPDLVKDREFRDFTYIGTSGFMNFDYVSHINFHNSSNGCFVKNVLIIDNSNSTKDFYQFIQDNILHWSDEKIAKTRIEEHFIANINKYSYGIADSLSDGAKVFSDVWKHYLDQEATNGISWLSNGAKFQTIQAIFKNRAFKHLTVDFSNTAKLREIRKCLNGESISLVYLSNLRDFISPEDFKNSRAALTEAHQVLFIDTKPVIFNQTSRALQKVYDSEPDFLAKTAKKCCLWTLLVIFTTSAITFGVFSQTYPQNN